ncbi:MAG: hypothetical protein INR71_03255 [Terriglobus roseus]|nr:hypothetical protein [Terriglobus roseus]
MVSAPKHGTPSDAPPAPSTLRLPPSPRSKKEANTHPKAHRIITQVVVTGARILGRAVAESWRQAQASQRYAAAAAKSNPGARQTFASGGLTLDEACKILDVAPPRQGKVDMERVMERFKRLFDQNEPKKGGSFYLQSKILRARERIELEVRTAEEAAQKEKEMKEGWNPKVYKDDKRKP